MSYVLFCVGRELKEALIEGGVGPYSMEKCLSSLLKSCNST